MEDFERRPSGESQEPPADFVDRDRGRRKRQLPTSAKALIGLFVLLLAAAAGWFWLGPGSGPDGGAATDTTIAAPDPDSLAAARARADSIRRAEERWNFELPSLAASDSVIRLVAVELSARPAWAEWLTSERLVRRFVGTVASVGSGSSPRESLEFMAPEGDFAVRDTGAERTTVAPAAFDRYDLMANTIASLDTEGVAQLYERLRPLFEEAHRELGLPEGRFDATMTRAVERLLSVEVPEAPIEVVDDEGVYTFQDPELEELSPIAKHLLRMGPENARRVQEKLREIADEIGLDVEG